MQEKLSVLLTLIELVLLILSRFRTEFIDEQIIALLFLILAVYILGEVIGDRNELVTQNKDYRKTEIRYSSWLYAFRERCEITNWSIYMMIIGKLRIKHESRGDSSRIE